MLCKNCGEEITLGAEYCANCGAIAEQSQVSSRTPFTPSEHLNPRSRYDQIDDHEYNQLERRYFTAPGRRMIKVTSILFIIVCAACVFVFGLALVGLTMMPDLIDESFPEWTDNDLRNARIKSVYMTFWCLYGVFVGIMGLVHSRTTAKGGFLMMLMWAYIALWAVDIVAGFMMFGATQAMCSCGDLILPILFLIGATKNKRAA
jgi:hypothetical protein